MMPDDMTLSATRFSDDSFLTSSSRRARRSPILPLPDGVGTLALVLYTAIVLPFQVIFSENELAAEFGGGWLGAMHVLDVCMDVILCAAPPPSRALRRRCSLLERANFNTAYSAAARHSPTPDGHRATTPPAGSGSMPCSTTSRWWPRRPLRRRHRRRRRRVQGAQGAEAAADGAALQVPRALRGRGQHREDRGPHLHAGDPRALARRHLVQCRRRVARRGARRDGRAGLRPRGNYGAADGDGRRHQPDDARRDDLRHPRRARRIVVNASIFAAVANLVAQMSASSALHQEDGRRRRGDAHPQGERRDGAADRAYFEYTWTRHRDHAGDLFIGSLPYQLRSRVSCLVRASDPPVPDLCQPREVYLPGEFILVAGYVSRCMYFVARGGCR